MGAVKWLPGSDLVGGLTKKMMGVFLFARFS